MVDEGRGLLCELGRHSTQSFNEPYSKRLRWVVDLGAGNARELSMSDIVAKGLRRPHSSIHSLFGVRQDLVLLRNNSGTSSENTIAMHPLTDRDKIKEYVLDRGDYSLRCTGGGELFRIVWREGPESSTYRAPIDLLLHAFVSEPSNRLVSFSSRGLTKTPNIQIRDLQDPSVIVAQWRQSASCLPWCDLESIYTLAEDQKTIESRSLHTGLLVESVPVKMPEGWTGTINDLDMHHGFAVGFGVNDSVDTEGGTTVVEFQTGKQLAVVPDTTPIDYAPVSKCLLLLPVRNSSQTLRVFSIGTRETVDLEGVDDDNLAKLHLSSSEPKAVAVMRDGSIRIHSLPDGKLVSNIHAMQNHKDVYVLLVAAACASWIVYLLVSGKNAGWYESIDIAIALAVIWCSLVLLHQLTLISIGLGAILSSISIGAICAAAIVLSDWSRSNSKKGTLRFVRWIVTVCILWIILEIEIQDQLYFDVCNVREARVSGFAILGMCYVSGGLIDAWKRWRFPVSKIESGNSTQWSIALLLRCTALMAVFFALAIRSPATVSLDWLWIGKLLLVLSLPISVGTFCCSVWREAISNVGSFSTTTRNWRYLVLSSACVFVIASTIATAFFCYISLGRGLQWSEMSMIEYCFWHTVGFLFVFSMLLYRTLPRNPIPASEPRLLPIAVLR